MQQQMNKGSLTRKDFFRISWMLLLLPFIWLWYSMVRRQRSTSSLFTEFRLPADVPLGISFPGRVIAIKDAGKVVFLTTRCTHLGCQIRSAENDELVCPCHGSRFGKDGRNLMGPASKPLARLPYRIDSKTGEFIVKIPEE
jgi:nitrite reductase/ring-hydroxylating ferredoxin subunit